MKKKRLLISLLLILISNITLGCEELVRSHSILNNSILNFYNANSTRSIDGSSYQKRVVRDCFQGKCHIDKLKEYILKYDPKHPDADTQGYVYYPNIDKNEELAMATMAAKKVLASKCLEKIVSKEDINFYEVKYKINNESYTSRFSFYEDRLSLWEYESNTGKSRTVDLSIKKL